MNRDEQGRVTVRALRLDGGIDLDGVLDEAVYRTVLAITGFIQLVPDAGAPATEPTEAWILFDDKNVYVSARDRLHGGSRSGWTAVSRGSSSPVCVSPFVSRSF